MAPAAVAMFFKQVLKSIKNFSRYEFWKTSTFNKLYDSTLDLVHLTLIEMLIKILNYRSSC